MNKKTRAALMKSIAHWERMLISFKTDKPTCEQCELCRLFNPPLWVPRPNDCFGCPVYAKTGKQYCNETPYISAAESYRKAERDLRGTNTEPVKPSTEFKKLARQEIKFLKSLLPEPTK